MDLSGKTNGHDVTQLLVSWREGDESVPARLKLLLYEELRGCLQRGRSDHYPQATSLVHEAYLHMVDDKQTSGKDRAHFYGIAARVMRQILVDHARAHN